jgi:hypothetical protein
MNVSAAQQKLGGRLQDLHRHLETLGIPLDGVSQTSIAFLAEATQEQRDVANAALAAWDWDLEPVPEVVPMHGLRKALRAVVISEDPPLNAMEVLETYISLPETDANLKDDLEYAPYVRRNHPSVTLFRDFLSKTEADVDALFIDALEKS